MDISPQVEARLKAAAQANGIDTAALFEKLLADYLPASRPTSAINVSPGDHFYFTATTEQFQNALAEISRMNRDIPQLSDDAFHRENLYEDRL